MSARPVFVLALRAAPNRNAIRELRTLLKTALRRHGFRCVHSSEVRAEDAEQHGPAYVHAGRWTFTLAEVWAAVDAAERAGLSLSAIGVALEHKPSTAISALVLRRHGVLRALADEAARGGRE
jgi:hypothetical protein